MNEKELKKYHLMSVQIMSAYHYILQAPGRLYYTKGKSDTYDMFWGGFFSIDHTSGYVSINHQVDINANETIKAKLTSEKGG